jgi:membrane protein DedA with SNARE-associated domain
VSVIPNECHGKWIAAAVLGLAVYFLVMSTLSFMDGDWLLGLLFVLLALVLVGVELVKFRSRKRAKRLSEGQS